MSHSSSKPTQGDRVRIHREHTRYAVLLNALARGWSGELHQKIQRHVPSKDLYLSDDFHQAERTVDKLLEQDYDVIFTGGGDGTIVYLVNAIEDRIRDGAIDRDDAPPVGVLRMGTGNAIASHVGAGDVTEDLRALRSGAPLMVYSIDMIEGAEGLFPFAGIGWDAEMLNDYAALRDAVHDTALEPYATGLGGYVASTLTRTIPNALKNDPVEIRMTNTGDKAMRIDSDGHVLEEYDEGDVLFEGEVRVVGSASVPYWGFKIRMFAHAVQHPGYAQVRCFYGSVGWILTHLPRFWKGDFPEEDIDDFLYRSVRLEVSGRPMPYQVAGDGAGYERQLDWHVADHPTQLAVPWTDE